MPCLQHTHHSCAELGPTCCPHLPARALPGEDQTYIIIADSVMKQLDGLKSGGYARGEEAQRLARCVREFMGRGLEACGPAGHNFLTVLGAHEGEGLVLEQNAAVAGALAVVWWCGCWWLGGGPGAAAGAAVMEEGGGCACGCCGMRMELLWRRFL
jgi:hypothetical protein